MDVKPLRRLFDTISSHVRRSLSAMNVQEDSYGNLLCPVLINKTPPELQLILSRKVSEEDWNLQTLMAAIEEEVIARKRLGQSQPKAPVHKGHSKLLPLLSLLSQRDFPLLPQDVAIVTKCTVQSNVQKSLKWTNENSCFVRLDAVTHACGKVISSGIADNPIVVEHAKGSITLVFVPPRGSVACKIHLPQHP